MKHSEPNYQDVSSTELSPEGKNQLKLLKVLDILQKYSDENHQLTVKDLADRLSAEGISTERKSIYHYIALLESTGVDIIKQRGKRNLYFIGDRQFELPELKILIDAVLAANFITAKKSADLIGKLVTSNVSIYDAQKLQSQVLFTKRPKTDNEKIFISVNVLHQAISEKRQVKFKYFDYNVNKDKVQRKSGGYYTVNPVCLIWDDDKYYLVAYHERHNDFTTYRIDKMEQVEATDYKALALPEGLNLQAHIDAIFNMYSGLMQTVTLKVQNNLIGVIIDRYGKQTAVIPYDENHFTVRLNVQTSPTFYGWLFTFGQQIRILAPQSVKDEYQDHLKQNLDPAP